MSDASRDPNVLHLLVLTPEEVLFEGDVAWVQVPLIDGLVGIWPGHAPLIGRMAQGTIEYTTPTGIEAVVVTGGVLRVDEGRCIVLMGALARGDAGGSFNAKVGAGVPESDVDLETIIESTFSADELRELQGE